MAKEEKMEFLLHLMISLILNLLLFTLLSLYLSVRIDMSYLSPLRVYLEDLRENKEVTLSKGTLESSQKPRKGEGFVAKGKQKSEASSIETNRTVGDMHVPTGTPKEAPSLLQEIEQKIRGKEKALDREGNVRGAELGEMSAVVSSGGVGISGGSRATIYTPPLPKITSDEPLSFFKVRVWVEPSGVVSKVQIIQKSGSPQVDQRMLEFVRGIRFEPIKENLIQTGVITFRFRGG